MRSSVTGVPLRIAVALAAGRGDGDLALHRHAVERELPADQVRERLDAGLGERHGSNVPRQAMPVETQL